MPAREELRDPLALPWMYLLSQKILGAMKARRVCVQEYAQAQPRMRILDIGCGPGYVLDYLPDVAYCGFDTSANYIAYARRKYGRRGEFYCQRFDAEMAAKLEPFDVVLMTGLLHHLEDPEAAGLLQLVRQSLKETGSLVTLDGCYAPGQSRIAKFMLQRDRGTCVREQNGYVRLAAGAFQRVDAYLRHDLFSIPYTALVMVCRP